ncbi:MAG: hypothetical protein R3D71_07570 [Rickettsiales bacterium]
MSKNASMVKCGLSSIKSNGKLRGRKRYRCNLCLHQWVDKRGKKTDYKRYYLDWLHKIAEH